MPDTVAVPTVVPPLVHVVGALGCGPNTLNVMVPVAPLPPDSVELIELAEMAVLVKPPAGPLADVAVAYCALTTLVKPEVAVHDA